MVEYTPIDKKLSDDVWLVFTSEILKKNYIEFQFPPTIPSDGRKGSWDEGEMRGYEPIATYKTSGPREFSVNYTYIVDGGEWTTKRISDNIHRIRGYFAQVRNGGDQRNLVVQFRMWGFGGDLISCRIKGVDVKHSDTIVVPDGDPKLAYPLRSDVSVEMRLWTKGVGNNADKPVQDLQGLHDNEPPEWY